MKFKDLEKFTKNPDYTVDYPLYMIPEKIADWQKELNLQLEPDFQRAHVWNKDKQIAFIEFLLKGGNSGKDIYFNHPQWQGNYKGEFVLVDGLQRITACLDFMNNKIPVFGNYYYSNFEDKPYHINLKLHVNDLKTRKEVLNWYLEMNSGGVVHTEDELNKVRKMLEQEP